MTDNELLALAAKAVNGGAWHPQTHDTPNGAWNPLQGDGDALRLAVALAIDVQLFAVRGTAGRPHDPFVRATVDRAGRSFVESATGDAAAATRRAIVRAAAALGGAA